LLCWHRLALTISPHSAAAMSEVYQCLRRVVVDNESDVPCDVLLRWIAALVVVCSAAMLAWFGWRHRRPSGAPALRQRVARVAVAAAPAPPSRMADSPPPPPSPRAGTARAGPGFPPATLAKAPATMDAAMFRWQDYLSRKPEGWQDGRTPPVSPPPSPPPPAMSVQELCAGRISVDSLVDGDDRAAAGGVPDTAPAPAMCTHTKHIEVATPSPNVVALYNQIVVGAPPAAPAVGTTVAPPTAPDMVPAHGPIPAPEHALVVTAPCPPCAAGDVPHLCTPAAVKEAPQEDHNVVARCSQIMSSAPSSAPTLVAAGAAGVAPLPPAVPDEFAEPPKKRPCGSVSAAAATAVVAAPEVAHVARPSKKRGAEYDRQSATSRLRPHPPKAWRHDGTVAYHCKAPKSAHAPKK